MIRSLCVAFIPFFFCACSSSSSEPSSPSAAGETSAACPSVAGTWNIAEHCDLSLVGKSAVVMESDCSLSFAAPFAGFTGTVASDGKLTLSGPQTCSGMASSSTIDLRCTPGTCTVKLNK